MGSVYIIKICIAIPTPCSGVLFCFFKPLRIIKI